MQKITKGVSGFDPFDLCAIACINFGLPGPVCLVIRRGAMSAAGRQCRCVHHNRSGRRTARRVPLGFVLKFKVNTPSRLPTVGKLKCWGKNFGIVFAAKLLPSADPANGADIRKAAGMFFAALYATASFKEVKRYGFINLLFMTPAIVHAHLPLIPQIHKADHFAGNTPILSSLWPLIHLKSPFCVFAADGVRYQALAGSVIRSSRVSSSAR